MWINCPNNILSVICGNICNIRFADVGIRLKNLGKFKEAFRAKIVNLHEIIWWILDNF